MYNYSKTQDLHYDILRLAIESLLLPKVDLSSNYPHYFRKRVCFNDIVHFIDQEKKATDVEFDRNFTFYHEAL